MPRTQKARRTKAGVCSECGAPAPGQRLCSACRQNRNKQGRKKRLKVFLALMTVMPIFFIARWNWKKWKYERRMERRRIQMEIDRNEELLQQSKERNEEMDY